MTFVALIVATILFLLGGIAMIAAGIVLHIVPVWAVGIAVIGISIVTCFCLLMACGSSLAH